MHPSATKTNAQRRITLLRHAEALPDELGDDHARVLTARGREAATALGDWMRHHAMLPDAVLSSTATRTRQTLAALNIFVPTELHKSLYLSSASDMFGLLQGCDDANQHILLIGHNPGIHALASMVAGEFIQESDAEAMIHRYPTCGLVSMRMPVDHWCDLRLQSGTVDALRFDSED